MLDTGIFDDDRYFDVFVEYAKAGPEDILMRVTVHNRGPEAATIHLLPQLWFRNTWSWKPDAPKPEMSARQNMVPFARSTRNLATIGFDCDGKPELLFCDNETNVRRLYGRTQRRVFSRTRFHDYVVRGNQGGGESRANRHKSRRALQADDSRRRLRTCALAPGENRAAKPAKPFADFDAIFAAAHARSR